MVMATKASAYVLAKDYDLLPGTILNSGKQWFLRTHLEENHNKYEGIIALTGDRPGEYQHLHNPSQCIAIPQAITLEARVIGDLAGPGRPPHGALVWGLGGLSIAGIFGGNFFVKLDGLEADDVLRDKSFYATKWGMWIVDGDGNALDEEPLFTVKAG